MLILDLIVSAITVAVVAAGAIMALLVNYFKPPADFMETVNQSFLPIDRDALQLLFEARPERVEFMALGRERVSVKEFDFMLAVVDQPYDDAPQNVEFKCPAVQVDRYLWRMDELPVAHLDIGS
ncbi:unnamed protein product [Callosobruchus maculatus]|uniref:Uncharacterized protein n=1 Tax=Callosobruchus maculatus TaxID=64391 RepID=A0A653C1Z1_CALMS|nr:unnamed protein product [Callosobruchus maculatus]